MKPSLVCKAILIPAVYSMLLIMVIIHAEGVNGLKPFVNVECLLIVFGGTFLLAWIIFPMREIVSAITHSISSDSELSEKQASRYVHVLGYCSTCALNMGFLTTILGVILALEDFGGLDRLSVRLAYAFTGLFVGLFLSKVIFDPMAQRIKVSCLKKESPTL